MIRISSPIFALVLLFPSLAMSDTVAWYDLVERDGLYYEESSDIPFTGAVTGQRKGQIKNGRQEGAWIWYWSYGRLRQKGSYKDGKRDGPWVWYNPDGAKNEPLSGTYRDGVKVSD
jgi:antitoxin component YwqK of YwqJK toxin-antitoxin module